MKDKKNGKEQEDMKRNTNTKSASPNTQDFGGRKATTGSNKGQQSENEPIKTATDQGDDEDQVENDF